MKTKPNALTVILLVVCMLLVVCVGGLSALTIKNMEGLGKELKAVGEKTAELVERFDNEEAKKKAESEPRENDVCIADAYYIRDTSAISDAYKSGDRSALDDRQKETLKMASDVLDNIIEPGMTPYEKEHAVYVFLTTRLKQDKGSLTVIPSSGADADNPYGVLKYHQAVCVGYATTFRLFMHMLDIDCMVVHNTSLSHSWDLINLDGEWYHTDCYFDTTEGDPSYRNFNLSDDVLGYDHDWDRNFFPKATGVKYNYTVKNAGEVDEIMDIPSFVKDKLESGESCFSLRVKGGITEDQEPVAAYLTETLASAVNSTSAGYFQYYWCLDANGDYVLCMFYRSYNEEPSPSIPDDIAERINEIINELFVDYNY